MKPHDIPPVEAEDWSAWLEENPWDAGYEESIADTIGYQMFCVRRHLTRLANNGGLIGLRARLLLRKANRIEHRLAEKRIATLRQYFGGDN